MPNRERTVLLIYTLLAAVGIAWSGFAGRGLPVLSPTDSESFIESPALLLSLGAGLLLAALSLAFTAVARRHWVRFQRLHEAFAKALGPLSQREIIVLKKKSRWQWIHPLPTKKDEVPAIFHGDGDGGIHITSLLPGNGSIGRNN